jgi:uncharacterized protein YukE
MREAKAKSGSSAAESLDLLGNTQAKPPTRPELEALIAEAQKLFADAIGELTTAQAALDSAPSASQAEKVSTLKTRSETLQLALDRLNEQLARADAEARKAAALAKVDAFDAALPGRVEKMRQIAARFVQAMETAKQTGDELTKEFDGFSDAAFEALDDISYAAAFKWMTYPVKWLELCLKGDRVSAPQFLKKELGEFVRFIDDIPAQIVGKVRRRREALKNPPPTAARRSTGLPLPATGPIPGILTPWLNPPEKETEGIKTLPSGFGANK